MLVEVGGWMKLSFTKAEMRKFLVLYHGLNELDHFGQGKEGIIRFFKRVGNIQMDPLNIVGINPEIMLVSRFKDFTPKRLNEMLYQDYTLVDGFDKEAAIYLMEDWGKFDLVRKKLSDMDWKVLEYRKNTKTGDDLDEVLDYVIHHPNTSSREIQLGNSFKTNWGSASRSNCALNHLWCEGKIGISSRKERIKSYAEITTLVPSEYRVFPFCSEAAFLDWYVMRRLDAMGFYWLKKGAGWQAYYLNDMNLLKSVIQRLVTQEKVVVIEIEGIKEAFYISKKAYEFLMNTLQQPLKEVVRFIAPLDNLIWDRKLVKELFGFEYVWEVYKPVNLRKYGYYVLPVLYKDQFIARIEPSREKDRKNILEIENIWYEDEAYNAFKSLIDLEIKRYNRSFSKEKAGNDKKF